MALEIVGLSNLGTVPKRGCNLVYKLEENDFFYDTGSKSIVQISFGFSAAIVAGDSFTLHGVTFTFVVTPVLATEIILGATLTQIREAIERYPLFMDNYDLSNSFSNSIIIEAKIAEIDSRFEYSFDTTNPNAIEVTPTTTPDQGSDPVTKENYIVLMDILDFATSEKFTTKPVRMDLSVFFDGSNAVCFDLEGILCSLSQVYTAPPLPKQPVIQGTLKPTNFDETYKSDRYEVRFYNLYTNPNNEGCETITDGVEYGDFTLVNMVQPVDYETLSASSNIFSDLYAWGFAGGKQFITNMPDSYKICKHTPFELRYDLSAASIDGVGGSSFLQVRAYYVDGTTDTGIFQIEDIRDGIHVANISIAKTGTSGNHTVEFPDYDKTVQRIEVQVYFTFPTTPVVLATKTIYVDNSSIGRCCGGCSKTFYFLGSLGNNDVLVARCESEINVDVEFNKFCKEVVCGGDDYFGVPQFDGGVIDQSVKTRQRVNKVYFEAESADYLEQFVTAPVKYIYEDDKIYRIYPTQSSYKIYQKNDKTIMDFTYVKSINPITKNLNQ